MAMFALVLTACQDKDIDRDAMILSAPDASQITGNLNGDDYVWTWPAQNGQMQVIVYRNGTLSSSEIVSVTASHTRKCLLMCLSSMCSRLLMAQTSPLEW